MQNNKPCFVNVIKNDNRYSFMVDGKPFYAKGAGLGDLNKIDSLVKAGANCIRTWSSVDAQKTLDIAQQNDVMVVLGFDLQKELFGFDYNDKKAVAHQFECFKQEVKKYKNHPSLLCWVIANEPNLLFDEQGCSTAVNTKVYDVLHDMICYLHKHDKNHPVSYAFAGVDKQHIEIALSKTPDVDIVSLQVYGDLDHLPKLAKHAGINKPIMITEYGPLGHWQTPSTCWGREIEEPSSQKAEGLKKRLSQCFKNDEQGLLIGDFVFYWGQKQERTPTWYGMFDKSGYSDARVDVMTEFWSGKLPLQQAPKVTNLTLNAQLAAQNVRVITKQVVRAELSFEQQDSEELTFEWYVLTEVLEKSDGGAFEAEPIRVDVTIKNQSQETCKSILEFNAPNKVGEYRLFCTAYNQYKK